MPARARYEATIYLMHQRKSSSFPDMPPFFSSFPYLCRSRRLCVFPPTEGILFFR
jgi:hypothetical protein